MRLLDHYRMCAAYNAWANRRLYAVAQALPDAAYRSDGGAFFGSLHGTLNHLLVTDRVWLHRFTGDGAAPTRLDAILCERLADLDAARVAEDARIVRYVDGLDEAALDGTIRYRRVTTPDPIEQPLAPALSHWFNHQTHHRGQAHALVTALGHRGLELDLLFFQRETASVPPQNPSSSRPESTNDASSR